MGRMSWKGTSGTCRRRVLGVVLTVLSVGCGSTDSPIGTGNPLDGGTGGGGGAGGGGTGGAGLGGNGGSARFSPQVEQAWSNFCIARAEKASQCSVPPSPCPSTTCLAKLYDEQLISEFITCQSAKSCTEFLDPNGCIRSVGTIGARQAFLDRCQAKVTDCGSPMGAYCATGLPIGLQSLVDAVDACLSKPCAELDACLTNVDLPDCW